MNFEPADPPLLDPYILERFTEDEMRKEEQSMRHKYVLRKLADFLPKHSIMKQSQNQQQINQRSSLNSNQIQSTAPTSPTFHYSVNFPPNVNVQTSSTFNFQSRETLPLLSMSGSGACLQPGSYSKLQPPPSPPDPAHRPPVNSVRPRATKRFTYSQSVVLEEFFQKYGSARIVDRIALAHKLGLYKNDVIGWFQSRRRKERRAMMSNSPPVMEQNKLYQNMNNGNQTQICSSGVR